MSEDYANTMDGVVKTEVSISKPLSLILRSSYPKRRNISFYPLGSRRLGWVQSQFGLGGEDKGPYRVLNHFADPKTVQN
jgi:hypothetical protein